MAKETAFLSLKFVYDSFAKVLDVDATSSDIME
jgi:hypothetical protein